MIDSDTRLLGDHWHQWLGSHCPALLLHGTGSTVLSTAQAREMASRRPGTTLVELNADHWPHLRRPKESAAAIRRFLSVPPTGLGPGGDRSQRRGDHGSGA